MLQVQHDRYRSGCRPSKPDDPCQSIDQRTGNALKRLYLAALSLPLTVISACKPVVLSPAGDVAAQQKDILLASTYLMLLIIIPVLCLVGIFAWKYRASNKDAVYDPDWSHSTRLELVIWAAPLLIVICLGGLTWVGTHLLDPYRPLDRISSDTARTADLKPLEVEVVSLDWKWLFIYPEYGIATVNELAAPVDRPIEFKLTSAKVMNAFYVPTLAGMIYTMPGMQTMLHGVINEEGVYDGFSSNYSGAGFSGMRFKFHALDDAGFEDWVGRVRASGATLDSAAYDRLETPSENVAPIYYGAVSDVLFHDILNLCTGPDEMCMDEMMMRDAQTQAGHAETPHDAMAASDMDHTNMDHGALDHAAMSHADMAQMHAGQDSDPQNNATRDAPKDPRRANRAMLRGHGLSQDLKPFFGAKPEVSSSETPAPVTLNPVTLDPDTRERTAK